MVMTAAAAFTACSNEELAPALSGGGVEIALRSNTIDASGVATRAPFADAISTSNVLEARVVGSITDNFVGTAYVNGIMKFNGGLAANFEADGLTGSSLFPDGVNPVHLFGVYPATWNISAGGQADFTFTGKEDVMATEKVSTLKQNVIDGSYKELLFKHLLTRLEVKLSAASTAVSTLGDVTAIKLIGDETAGTTPVNNRVLVANNGAPMNATFSSVSATSMNFYSLSLDGNGAKVYTDNAPATYTLTTASTFVAYSMVAPVTASAANKKEYFLELTTTAAGVKRIPVDLKSSANTDFAGSTAGRSFVVSIYFKSNLEIAVDATVEAWIEEGEWQGEYAID